MQDLLALERHSKNKIEKGSVAYSTAEFFRFRMTSQTKIYYYCALYVYLSQTLHPPAFPITAAYFLLLKYGEEDIDQQLHFCIRRHYRSCLHTSESGTGIIVVRGIAVCITRKGCATSSPTIGRDYTNIANRAIRLNITIYWVHGHGRRRND